MSTPIECKITRPFIWEQCCLLFSEKTKILVYRFYRLYFLIFFNSHLKSSVQLLKSLNDEDSEKEHAIWSTTWLNVTTFLLFKSLFESFRTVSLLVLRRLLPGIWRLLEDSFRMILSLLEWPLRPLEVEWELLIFSADLAALMTMLSKLADEIVLFVACGVTNIFNIFRRSSSEAVLFFSEIRFFWVKEREISYLVSYECIKVPRKSLNTTFFENSYGLR